MDDSREDDEKYLGGSADKVCIPTLRARVYKRNNCLFDEIGYL